MHKIDKRIIGYKVLSNNTGAEVVVATTANIVPAETPCVSVEPITKEVILERPDILYGATYKIKVPVNYPHAVFLTINNYSEDGQLGLFEIFFNTKDTEILGWLNTLALTITSMLRTRQSISHLLEEYKTMQDGRGSYFSKKSTWLSKPRNFTSILGEIATVLEYHIKLIESTEADCVGYMEEPATLSVNAKGDAILPEDGWTSDYPPNATICSSCSAKAVVLMDGCATCLECGGSKCN